MGEMQFMDAGYDEAGAGRRSGGSGLFWFWAPLSLYLVASVGLAIAAYVFAEPQLSIMEAAGAGFGGVAAVIVGLVSAAIGVVLGLVGAVFGLAVAGGSLAVTLFVVGSPLLAIILLFLLFRRRGSTCPDPSVH